MHPYKQQIHLVVDLRDENTVKALKAQVQSLEGEYTALKERCRIAEYNLMCECQVNMQLTDLCREQGIKVPRRLFHPKPALD